MVITTASSDRFGFVANVHDLFQILVLALHFSAQFLQGRVVEIATFSGTAEQSGGGQEEQGQDRHIVPHLCLVSNLSTADGEEIFPFHSVVGA